MRIKNLGPISDAQIGLNRLVLFVGDNGTGKTLAAYSLFAFRNWLENSLEVEVMTSVEIDQLLVAGELNLSATEMKSTIAEQIMKTFNDLNVNGQYFVDFFKNGAYVPGESMITIDKADALSLVKESKVGFDYFAENSWDGNCQYQICVDSRDGVKTSIYYELVSNHVERPRRVTTREALLRLANQSLVGSLFDTYSRSRYLPAERTGLSVLRAQFNVQVVDTQFTDPASARVNQVKKRYPWPIEAYILFLNHTILAVNQPESPDMSAESKNLIARLVPGKFMYDSGLDTVRYQLGEKTINFEFLSSSLKSVFGLKLFMLQYRQEDWLFIDEPESNLHPHQQVIMMDLLVALAVSGNHVVMSTHSDYMVKELLNKLLESKLADESQRSGMVDWVSVFEFRADGVHDLGDILAVEEFDNFDRTTITINDRYYELREQLDDEGRTPAGKKKIDHLPYEVSDEDRAFILHYINMDGGNEQFKKKLLTKSIDEINEENIQKIIYQMTHGETHI